MRPAGETDRSNVIVTVKPGVTLPPWRGYQLRVNALTAELIGRHRDDNTGSRVQHHRGLVDVAFLNPKQSVRVKYVAAVL